MIKLSAAETMDTNFSLRQHPIFKKLVKILTVISNTKIFSEDINYKWNFIKHYMPELYEHHTLLNYTNCVFCSKLVGTGCSKHCFKCSDGTYIHSSPLLPGTLFTETYYPFNSEIQAVPWYFKNTCRGFSRLQQRKYFKNLGSFLSTSGIHNFEVLEGLEKGLSAGEKPCHVCASVDYDIYKNCSSQKVFDKCSPCQKISDVLSKVYTAQ